MATNSIAIPIVQINGYVLPNGPVTMYFPSTGLIVQPATGTVNGNVVLSSFFSVHQRDRLDGTPLYLSTLTASAINVLQNT